MEKEICEHAWKKLKEEKRVKNIVNGGLFAGTYAIYEMVILQQCEKCGKLDSVRF